MYLICQVRRFDPLALLVPAGHHRVEDAGRQQRPLHRVGGVAGADQRVDGLRQVGEVGERVGLLQVELARVGLVLALQLAGEDERRRRRPRGPSR